MMRIALWSIVAVASMTVSDSEAKLHDSAPEDEIVVVGRNMRTVRLTYAWSGRSLQNCFVQRSSGDASIDRMMCTILQTCVRQGYGKISIARQCMDRRTERLVDEARRRGDDHIALPDDPFEDILSADVPSSSFSTSPGAGSPEEPEQEADIIVEGRRNPIRGGLWQIERTNVFSGGGAGEMPYSAVTRFAMCLPDTSVRKVLKDLVRDQAGDPGMQNCGSKQFATQAEFFNMRLKCVGDAGGTTLSSLNTTHDISLVYGRDKTRRLRPDAFTTVHTVEFDAKGSRATFRRGAGEKQPARYLMFSNVVRIGECPDPANAINYPHDDAPPMMFGLEEIFDAKGMPIRCPKWKKAFIPVKCGMYQRPSLRSYPDTPDQVRSIG